MVRVNGGPRLKFTTNLHALLSLGLAEGIGLGLAKHVLGGACNVAFYQHQCADAQALTGDSPRRCVRSCI